MVMEVDKSWRISIELNVFSHQLKPHFAMGNWKYRLAVNEANVMHTVGI